MAGIDVIYLSVTFEMPPKLSVQQGNTNIQAIKEQLWILWPIFALLESHYNFITLSINTNSQMLGYSELF